ncbi:MAG: 5'-3' exonuclease H3TH domain-containing protein [Actinomycetota bacterium]|nr:5'-3' exonuclease H3TH domain-containing protein [Actinomycetota bacterium]
MSPTTRVHLLDGTFELFRCFHGAPRAEHGGREVGAARGLLATLVSLLRDPEVTHVAVAFDSVVAPPGKGTGPDALIGAQAPLAAEITRALGLVMWPTGRYQADEMLATAAARFAALPEVQQVVICANDNDFDQCVVGERVVVLDRIRKVLTDETAVRARWGVAPAQVPELFALVGDRSDGLPGVPGWGVRSAAALLAAYGTVAEIPLDEREWNVTVRGAARLAALLRDRHDEALLCADISRLRTDLPLRTTLADLEWHGARRERMEALCGVLGDDAAMARITRWAGA